MKRLFACLLPFVFAASSFASVETIEEKERAIYFCHRDIASYIRMLDTISRGYLAPIGIEKRDPDDVYDNTSTSKNFSTVLAKPRFDFRHCFFLMGDKITEYYEQKKVLLSLEELETRGMGYAGSIEKAMVKGGEDINTIRNQPISCVPIIKDNEHDRIMVSKELGYDYVLPHLYLVWGEILNLMSEKEKEAKKYNYIGNHCCTAAYDITKQLIGASNAEKIIDPDSFNFNGMGILWGTGPWSLGAASDSTMGAVRICWHIATEVADGVKELGNKADELGSKLLGSFKAANNIEKKADVDGDKKEEEKPEPNKEL